MIGLAIAVLAIGLAGCQSYVTIRERYCSSVDVESFNSLTKEERESKRAEFSTPFSFSFSTFLGLSTQSFGASISSLIGPSITGLASVIVAVVTLVLMGIFLCACQKSTAPNDQTAKIFFVSALVCLVILIGLTIWTGVVVGQVYSNYPAGFCSLAMLATHVLSGTNSETTQFVGLNGLVLTMQNFKSEITNVGSVAVAFDSLNSLNLPEIALNANMTLKAFYMKYKDTTVVDGVGQEKAPQTVQNLTDGVSKPITTEFGFYLKLVNLLQTSFVQGRQYGNQSTLQAVSAAVAFVISKLGEIATSFAAFAESLNAVSVSASDYAGPLLLGVSLALYVGLGFTAIASFVYYCMFAKKRCLILKKVWKLVLFIIAVCALCLSVGVFLFAATSSSVNTVCSTTTGLLKPDSLSPTLANMGLDEKMNSLLSNCLGDRSATNTSNLFSANADYQSSYNAITFLLDGIKIWASNRIDITTSSTSSESITKTVSVWQRYRQGIYLDHPNVQDSLNKLNEAILCDLKTLRLNALNCTEESTLTCKGIIDLNSFAVPDCSDVDIVNAEFNKLKAYITFEKDLMENMIKDLSSVDESPNVKFQKMKKSLQDIKDQMAQITNALGQTLNGISIYSKGFQDISDCSMIVKEFEFIESALCFQSNQKIFFGSIALFMTSFVLCLILVFLWLSFRSLVEEVAKEKAIKSMTPDSESQVGLKTE